MADETEHWRTVNWGSLDTAHMVWGMAATYAALKSAPPLDARADNNEPGTSKVQDIKRIALDALGEE